MTDCPRGDVRDLLPELVHGRLDAATRAEVERHVAECAECAAEVKLLGALRDALASTPTVDIARISAAVRATRGASAPGALAHRLGRWHGWRAAAGIAAVTVGVMSWAVARRVGDHAGHGASTDAASRSATAIIAAVPPARSGSSARQADTMRPAPRAESTGAPRSVAPRAATEPSDPARQLAQQPRGLSADGGVSDLPDADLRELLETIDHLDALPDADPAPTVGPVGPDDLDAGAI